MNVWWKEEGREALMLLASARIYTTCLITNSSEIQSTWQLYYMLPKFRELCRSEGNPKAVSRSKYAESGKHVLKVPASIILTKKKKR